MKYAHIDSMTVEQHPHLAELIWPDRRDRQVSLGLHAQFYAVPVTHPNIDFIAFYADLWSDIDEPADDPGLTGVRSYIL